MLVSFEGKGCVRCPFYKGSYRAGKCKTPVAADILKRVIMSGIVERDPKDVKRQAAAIKRAIKLMESE